MDTCPTCHQEATGETAAWLARRMVARRRLDRPRCWGVSSDALAAYGAGYGPRPTIPGKPYEAKTSNSGRWVREEAGDYYPHDIGDLNACELTFAMAPDHAKFRMKPVLDEFRAYVLDGLDRYGDPAHMGTAWGRKRWTPWDEIDLSDVA